MEDYDVYNEMHKNHNKKIVMVIEDDEKFISENLLDSNIEIMPFRFSYDLSKFSRSYIDKTAALFTYYYTKDNYEDSELLRLKKHFVHYNRKPIIIYIPFKKKYEGIYKFLSKLDIEIIRNKNKLLKKIKNVDKRIYFIDGDETLVNSQEVISEKNKETIELAKQAGHKVVICTSRPRYHSIKISMDSNASSIIVSFNGGEVYDRENNKVIFNKCINPSNLYKLIDFAYENDVRVVVGDAKNDYVSKNLRNDSQILLDKDKYKEQIKSLSISTCMIIDEKANLVEELMKYVKNDPNLSILNIKEDDYYEMWFTIGNSKVNKGVGVKEVCDYYNIPLKNTIAIGNGINDIAMFETTGFSIAVDNASDVVKEYADYITDSNDNDGVSKAILYDLYHNK